MENKINVAEILKDCPKGMELYSPIFGKVYLDKIRPYLGIVVATDKEQGGFKEEFLYDGRYGMNGECMIFPSKDQRDWSKFGTPYKFKNGDIYYIKDVFGQEWVSIIKKCENDKLYTYVDIGISDNSFYCEASEGTCYCRDIIEHRLVTEDEKAKLFQSIKYNGYRWNKETKTLEKLPKFKVGDKIKNKYTCEIVTVKRIYEFYYIVVYNKTETSIDRKLEEHWELVSNKFDINSLKPFKSRVLVRGTECSNWKPAIFGCYIDESASYYVLGGTCWRYCIPYDGNEHLLGTNNDCSEYYKNW